MDAEADYNETRKQIAAEFERRLEMLRQMEGPTMKPGEPLTAEDLEALGVHTPPSERLRYDEEHRVWIREPVEPAALGVFRLAAEWRERIVLALCAEVRDRATAERLAAAVVRALEEG